MCADATLNPPVLPPLRSRRGAGRHCAPPTPTPHPLRLGAVLCCAVLQVTPASDEDVALRTSYYSVPLPKRGGVAVPVAWLSWQAEALPPAGVTVFALTPSGEWGGHEWGHQRGGRHPLLLRTNFHVSSLPRSVPHRRCGGARR